MTAEKDWIDILQALLTPTVAIFGSYIAYQQWHINKARLKHELYDRRMAVYTALMDYLVAIFREEYFDDKAYTDWLSKSHEGYFLFNDEIDKYLKLINMKSHAIRKIHRRMSSEKVKEDEELWGTLSTQDEELQQWFEMQLDNAKEKFSPFLRLNM